MVGRPMNPTMIENRAGYKTNIFNNVVKEEGQEVLVSVSV